MAALHERRCPIWWCVLTSVGTGMASRPICILACMNPVLHEVCVQVHLSAAVDAGFFLAPVHCIPYYGAACRQPVAVQLLLQQ